MASSHLLISILWLSLLSLALLIGYRQQNKVRFVLTPAYAERARPDGDALRHIVIRETHWDHDGSPNDDMTISVPGAAPQPAAGVDVARPRPTAAAPSRS